MERRGTARLGLLPMTASTSAIRNAECLVGAKAAAAAVPDSDAHRSNGGPLPWLRRLPNWASFCAGAARSSQRSKSRPLPPGT